MFIAIILESDWLLYINLLFCNLAIIEFKNIGSLTVTKVPPWCRMLIGEEAVCGETRVIWNISVPSAQFWCEHKTVIKIKSKKERKKRKLTLWNLFLFIRRPIYGEGYIQHMSCQLEKNQEVTFYKLKDSWHYILSEYICKNKCGYQIKRS